jgi:excisionase family DNA binding protein
MSTRLAWLVANPDSVADVALEEIPRLKGALAEIDALLQLRLNTAPLPSQEEKPGPGGDRLLTIAEAAKRINVKTSWIYDHQKTLPFIRKLGTRTLRVSEQELEYWMNNGGRRP